MKNYKHKGFRKSRTKNKKYDAVLENHETGRVVHMPFGDTRYGQYEDCTPLNLYSSKNHRDKERRASYKKRHDGYLRQGYYSPGWFSMNYLW